MSGFIYLASQSPRRRQLLDQIGVRYELLLPGDEEDAERLEEERPGETPDDYVERVTRAKLSAAVTRRYRRSLPVAPVLCADTTVSLGSRILGKPVDAADAVATLTALSGVPHRVITAIAVGLADGRALFAKSTSEVHLGHVDPAEIEAYVASGDPFGKAGAYAIQSRAAAWVRHIEGSYSGIMGLPLFETAQLLRQAGLCF
jgi:septum formation protein